MIKAKFHAPSMQLNIVSRETVQKKLGHIPEYRYVSVVAPAGYGKTTAILSWLQTCGLPAAWLSLDAYDNHPATFWRYACAALDRIAAGVAKDVDYVFASQELMDANMHISILIDRLSAVSSDFLLVLDDLHLISDPAIMQGLSYLADYMPANMHLILIGRTEPQLRLTKHRMAGQMLRLDNKDLRFCEADIFSFYQARGYALGTDDVKRLERYTEGWAAALVAVAMSMEYERSSSDVIAALARASRDIGEYLKNEVIRSWSPEKLRFAMWTSILETLTEPLCNAVAGGGDARRMLAEISQESGFLIALDERRSTYQYHQLFRGFLQGLLADAAAEETAALHISAARWLREHGFVPEAIEHLLRGGAFGEVLDLFEYQIGF